MKKFIIVSKALIASALAVWITFMTLAIPCAAAVVDKKSIQIEKQLTELSDDGYYSSIANKINEFLNDSRWSDGTKWGYYQRPILSHYDSIGCCAFTSDFAKYVYGTDDLYYGDSRYYDINAIRVGDVVYMKDYQGDSGHWFAVIGREGNTLTCAEANWGARVVIGKTRTINSEINRFDEDNQRYFDYGIRYIDDSQPVLIPDKPSKVSGLMVTKTTRDSVKITWNGVSGANIIYMIYVDGKYVSTTSDTSFIHTGLSPESCYTYQVRACANYRERDLSVQSVNGKKSRAVVGVTNR